MSFEINIKPNDYNNLQDLTLGGSVYTVGFRYINRSDAWEFSLFNDKGEALIKGCRIVPNIFMLSRLALDVPDLGDFICLQSRLNSLSLSRDNFGVGKDYRFVYVTRGVLDGST